MDKETNLGYKQVRSLQQRKDTARKIADYYPDAIPVILQKTNSKTIYIKQQRFLVPRGMSFERFVIDLRQKLVSPLQSHQTLFLFVNGRLPLYTQSMEEIYEKHKDEDGMLYMTVTTENTFG